MYDIKLIIPHGLRHTFATILISAGAPVITIAKILGNTPQTLMKTYAHSFAENEKKAVQTLASIVNFD